jgi:hypothetical protein
MRRVVGAPEPRLRATLSTRSTCAPGLADRCEKLFRLDGGQQATSDPPKQLNTKLVFDMLQ